MNKINCVDGITSKNSDINIVMKMKEEADTSSKLPPKIIMMGGVGGSSTTMATTTMLKTISSSAATIPNVSLTTSNSSFSLNPSTPSKQQSDEILSTLLRMNNFDSISSIKDESLDIDLSACVTISADPSGIIGGNSLSSSDFWRVLDESAQTSQLDVSSNSIVGGGGNNTSRESLQTSPSASSNGNSSSSTNDKNELKLVVKKEQTDFSGTFLKPSTGISFSPLKRSIIKPLQAEQQIRKEKSPTRLAKSETGPPSLAPIMRIQQTYIKPQEELPKLNNTNISLNSSQTVEQQHKQQKNLMLVNNQPPPLAALETSTNKVAVTTKPLPLAEPMYKCLDCENVIFRGSQELAIHTNHRIIYKCSDCDREFDLETSLKKHLKTHRPIDARKDAWKKCPDCGKCLKLGSMWMHRKIHTENKKYGCEICGQKFVQKINLTHHQRIHTSEKPYECSECQKRFQERSHLQRHQKYHAQTRSYRCEKCGKMYKTERCLKVHNLVHLEQRPFACTVCDKSFISNSKLKQHSNIHTGERPFKCNYCPRDFTNFPNWLKHTRRRHKVDHKTGEMLENIPSYCSKKSTRTPKEKKTNEVKTIINSSNKININPSSSSSSSNNASVATNQKHNDLSKMDTNEVQQQQKQMLATFSTAITTTTTAPTTVFTTINLTKPITAVSTSSSKTQLISSNGPPPLAKVPAKRKKKQNPTVASQIIKTECDVSTITTAATTLAKNFLVASSPLHNNLPVVTSIAANNNGPPPLALVYNAKSINVIGTTLSTTNTTNNFKTSQQQQMLQPQLQQQQQQPLKVEKVKRERKQPMPKQVQQVPPPLIIKKEFVEPKTEINITSHEQQHHQQERQQQLAQQQLQQRLQQSHSQQQAQQNNKVAFTDLHCLSITSAEELIMEQALEMEECGLYKASLPNSVDNHVMPNFADTDNAISSDSMADLHFKIKEEHHDMDLKLKAEEYETIKKQSICSSLESSPFSSPASMEFAPSSTLNTTNDFTTNNFYLPPFTTANNQIITTNAPITTMRIEDARGHTYLPQLITTNVSVPELIQINNNNQRYLKATTATSSSNNNANPSFINQLYFPLTVNAGPVLMKSNQALPSVDTLLFSNSKLGLFNNRNLPKQATTAQHNLS